MHYNEDLFKSIRGIQPKKLERMRSSFLVVDG